MTTGQGAAQATWLLTEPTPSWPRPPLPREPTTSRSAYYPALRSSAAGEPGITWTATGPAGPDWLLTAWSTSSCTSSAT